MNTSEQIADLVGALVKAHAQFKPVVRNTTGQVGQNRNYKYADLAGLIDATFPALLANGLVVVQAVDAESSSMVSRLAHTSGQWLESAYPLGKYDRPQDFGSQLSYARRYSLLALLGVAQEDDDAAEAQQATRTDTAKPATTRPANGSSPLPDLPADVYRVTKVDKKPGTNARGPYTTFKVTFSDGKMASTFSTTLGKLAEQLQASKEPCTRLLEPKGNFLNLIELVAAKPTDEDEFGGEPEWMRSAPEPSDVPY